MDHGKGNRLHEISSVTGAMEYLKPFFTTNPGGDLSFTAFINPSHYPNDIHFHGS